MLVHALVAAIRTRPEPTVFAVLDRLNEVLAHFVRRRFRIAVLGHDHLPQLLLVPVFHPIFLLPLLLRFPSVLIQVYLLHLPLHRQVVRELALLPLLAIPLLVELAHDRFRVHAEGHFLHLHRLEECRRFQSRFLRRRLFLFPLFFLRIFSFLLGRFRRRGLGLELGYLFLCCRSFFL